jgi:hypothetical protein
MAIQRQSQPSQQKTWLGHSKTGVARFPQSVAMSPEVATNMMLFGSSLRVDERNDQDSREEKCHVACLDAQVELYKIFKNHQGVYDASHPRVKINGVPFE